MLSIRAATVSDVPLLLRFSREFAEFERQPGAVVIEEETLIRDGFGAQPKFRSLIAGMGRTSDWLCALLWLLFKLQRLRYLSGGPLRTGKVSRSRNRKSTFVSGCSYCPAGRLLWHALGGAGLE
jgi:hypothetical protein